MFLFLNLESNLNKSKNQVLHHSRSLRKHLCWLKVVRGLPGWLERETLQKQETAPDSSVGGGPWCQGGDGPGQGETLESRYLSP